MAAMQRLRKIRQVSQARPGAFAFADAGYFVEVMGREPALLAGLSQLYDDTAQKGDAALAEGGIDTYLSDFARLFKSMEARPAIWAAGLQGLSSKFFGDNAATFVGLRKGEAARIRLDAFYRKNGVGNSGLGGKGGQHTCCAVTASALAQRGCWRVRTTQCFALVTHGHVRSPVLTSMAGSLLQPSPANPCEFHQLVWQNSAEPFVSSDAHGE
jgi:hypothetical protein